MNFSWVSVVFLVLTQCFSSTLLGLKVTTHEINRIPFYNNDFVSIDLNSGSLNTLHHIGLVPSQNPPQGFAIANPLPSPPLLYVNMHQSNMLSCVWTTPLRVSKSSSIPFVDCLTSSNKGGLYGFMGNTIVSVDPSSARTSPVVHNIPYQFCGGSGWSSSSSQTLFLNTDLILGPTCSQAIVSYPAGNITKLHPSNFCVESILQVSSSPLSSVPVVFRNATGPDVRYGWYYGTVNVLTGQVTPVMALSNDMSMTTTMVLQGNIVYALLSGNVIARIDIVARKELPELTIQGLSSNQNIVDMKSSTFI